MSRVNPVDEATTKFFFGAPLPEISAARDVRALSYVASLDHSRARHRISGARYPKKLFSATSVNHDVHRFEQSIAGRPYLIEVAAVAKDRWRAYIVRVPGMPTALMPFYGRTPNEAAEQLSAWLTRAHARAAAPAGSV